MLDCSKEPPVNTNVPDMMDGIAYYIAFLETSFDSYCSEKLVGWGAVWSTMVVVAKGELMSVRR